MAKQTSVEEIRKRKKKLIEELGEEKVAELEKAEEPQIADLSVEEINRAMALAPTTGKGLKLISRAQNIGEQTTPEQEKLMLEEARKQKELELESTSEAEDRNIAKKILERAPESGINRILETSKEAVEAAFPAAFTMTSDFLSTFKKFTGGFLKEKKQLSTKDMEETFNMGRTALANEFTNVLAGRESSIDFHSHLRQMNRAINQLDSKLKFISQSSALFWLSDGKDIEADLIEYRETLSAYNIQVIRLAAGVGLR